MGILPRGYTLSSLEALKKEGSLNVQAGTAFVDFEFLEEVSYVFQSEFAVIFQYSASLFVFSDAGIVCLFLYKLGHLSLPWFSCNHLRIFAKNLDHFPSELKPLPVSYE